MSKTPPKPHVFPLYDRTEQLADRIVHLAGIAAALAGLAWLISRLPPHAGPKLTASVFIYGTGLLCMLTASALYNSGATGTLKARFRRLDHAMIFVMIAGSYTPFALNAFPVFSGHLLLGLVWAVALAGIILEFFAVLRAGHFAIILYVAMGWIVLAFLPILIAAVTARTLILLVLGGVVYSLGAAIHAWAGIRFHNVIWHIMVVLGAALQFGAIAQLV